MNENNGSLKPVWKELTRKGKNLPVLLVDCAAHAFLLKTFAQVHGLNFNPRYYRQMNYCRWIDASEYEKWQNALREKEECKPGWLYALANDFEKTSAEFDAYAKRIADEFASVGSGKASNAQLDAWFGEFFLKGSRAIAFDYDYNFLNNFYADPLFAEIARAERDAVKQNEFLQVLLSADEFSDTRLEKENLVKIARLLEKSGEESEAISNALRSHAQRFGFMGMHYFENAPLAPNDFLERAKHLIETGLDKEEEKLVWQRGVAAKSREIAEHLRLSEDARLRVKTLKKTAFEVNYFDECWNRACSRLLPLFNEIARRLGVSYKEFCQFTRAEIAAGLKQGAASAEAKAQARAREIDHALVLQDERIFVFTGAELAEYRANDKTSEVKALATTPESRELHGLCASPGKARGRVRILLRPEEIPLLQKGEVLVAKMTAPSFVPAMEKACALVAEQGGLLCHTAIVGRELGVPTIVGVKDATRVLRNGELVEVDATNGVVKKVS